MYSNGRFATVADDPAVVPHLEGLIDLSNRIQRFFREWAAIETTQPSSQFVDLYAPHNFMVTLHTAMMGTANDFAAQFDANVRMLRQVAGQLIDRVVTDKCRAFSDDAVMRQVQAWQRDSFLRELRSTYREEQSIDPLSQEWIVDTTPALQFN
jgi:hypothetical protein